MHIREQNSKLLIHSRPFQNAYEGEQCCFKRRIYFIPFPKEHNYQEKCQYINHCTKKMPLLNFFKIGKSKMLHIFGHVFFALWVRSTFCETKYLNDRGWHNTSLTKKKCLAKILLCNSTTKYQHSIFLYNCLRIQKHFQTHGAAFIEK